jgi:hypothetical protein
LVFFFWQRKTPRPVHLCNGLQAKHIASLLFPPVSRWSPLSLPLPSVNSISSSLPPSPGWAEIVGYALIQAAPEGPKGLDHNRRYSLGMEYGLLL